jgi:hypothetical protein
MVVNAFSLCEPFGHKSSLVSFYIAFGVVRSRAPAMVHHLAQHYHCLLNFPMQSAQGQDV